MILSNFYKLSNGNNFGEWRKKESQDLSKKVQNVLKQLQNPSDCDKAKKIICDLNKSCGFGCQMHHLMYCFITAYASNRNMILESKQGRYKNKGFEAYFKPLSESCLIHNGLAANWNGWLFLVFF